MRQTGMYGLYDEMEFLNFFKFLVNFVVSEY